MKKLSQKKKNILIISLILFVIVGTIAIFVPLIIMKKNRNTMLDTPVNIGIYSVLDDFYIDVDKVAGAEQYYFIISPPNREDIVLTSQTNQLKITQVMFAPGIYYAKCYARGESEQSRSLYSEYFMFSRVCQLDSVVLFKQDNNLKWADVQDADSYVLYTTSAAGNHEYELSNTDIEKENGYVIFSLEGKTYETDTTFYVKAKSNNEFISVSEFSNGVTLS